MTTTLFPKTPSILDSRATVYATITLESQPEDDGDDRIAIVLPTTVSQPVTESADDEILQVEYDAADGIVRWVGTDGKDYQLGEAGKPFDAAAKEALQSELGLLVLFIDQTSGDPQHWIAIRSW